jgi:hypothetical protein
VLNIPGVEGNAPVFIGKMSGSIAKWIDKFAMPLTLTLVSTTMVFTLLYVTFVHVRTPRGNNPDMPILTPYFAMLARLLHTPARRGIQE